MASRRLLALRLLLFVLLATSLTLTSATPPNRDRRPEEEVLIKCETTKGPVDVVVQPWRAPLGAGRFLELVDAGEFGPKLPLFRCVEGFLCQFGYRPTGGKRRRWSDIQDDPMPRGTRFYRGDISYAGGGANTRSSHLFVTLGKHVKSLGTEPWETPFAFVTPETMEATVSKWSTQYGDMPPWGKGPNPSEIERTNGQAYLDKNFPDLDYWLGCSRSTSASLTAANVNANAKTNADGAATQNKPYQVLLRLSTGDVVVEVNPEWAPLAAQRFRELVESHFLDEARFFRVVPGFVAQFGLPADPKAFPRDRFPKMKDDPVLTSNVRGTIAFASSGPDTRTTQMFFNYGDNGRLDKMGFAPFGRIVRGIKFVDAIYDGYGERPSQGDIQAMGNAYLNEKFPNLSFIRKAEMLPWSRGGEEEAAGGEEKRKKSQDLGESGAGGPELGGVGGDRTVPARGAFETYFSLLMAVVVLAIWLGLVRALVLNANRTR